ncbi:DUF1413 domain-containing protein [Staphylococcus sp. NRL 16/872]|uniref:DUF1413 domain-containing protein n=1 Tax=Staphylococcus sp. NRL 16/872 TaxID=2930131 RepID=UPI001FB50AF3|nr:MULTISPECIES: DUF1413 domain-containing protein [unclassified Staphylococcus]MCJ1656315.1 single-stranded DNA-binding protein [Staphylococcus sp. NRL 21/187]MCJ1662075.1 single-stranded DNA-binding protein [Staphylococcus sp. NRL 18/288]MCJ1668138.1 single-stranded DNA-binding protein [Staphylococcus sp. NRL 19/737]WEN68337.1 DUF1413 domain-containing protein [Staphylococcus sp. NRL 16/872]
MICCVNKHVKYAVENLQTIAPQTVFEFKDLLGDSYYHSLENSEQEFIEFKFHELILRGEIMNVSILDAEDEKMLHYIKNY